MRETKLHSITHLKVDGIDYELISLRDKHTLYNKLVLLFTVVGILAGIAITMLLYDNHIDKLEAKIEAKEKAINEIKEVLENEININTKVKEILKISLTKSDPAMMLAIAYTESTFCKNTNHISPKDYGCMGIRIPVWEPYFRSKGISIVDTDLENEIAVADYIYTKYLATEGSTLGAIKKYKGAIKSLDSTNKTIQLYSKYSEILKG